MRPFESWMQKGARVMKSNLVGTLEVVNTCETKDGIQVLNPVYVKLDGVAVAAPFHPSDIEPIERQQENHIR